MQPNKDLLEFIDLLNANRVEYLVVGGFALAWHGYPRFTADIDFLVRPDKANGELLVKTLVEFGFRSLGLGPGFQPPRPNCTARSKTESHWPNHLDCWRPV